MVVRVSLDNGAWGEGEAATSFTRPRESLALMGGVLRGCKRRLQGAPIEAWETETAALRTEYTEAVMIVSGLEVALFRAWLAARGSSEQNYWGGRLDDIETDLTVPHTADRHVLGGWIDYGLRKGFIVFKVKVSGDADKDLTVLALIRSMLASLLPEYRLRLDGNQGFTADGAIRLLERLEKEGYPIDLIEQPLPKDDISGLAEVRRRSHVPVIVDEAVETVRHLERVIGAGAADGVNVKIAKSGITESRRIIEMARHAGLKLMIGCMTETMTGLSAAIHMAVGSGVFDYIDLDSIHFLHGRNRYGDIVVDGPRYLIVAASG